MFRPHSPGVNRRRHRRLFLGVAVALPVVMVAALGAAAADDLPGLSLGGGQSATVSCAGAHLTLNRRSATTASVGCVASPVTTTTAPPPTTTTTTAPPPSWWSIPTGSVSWQWVLNHPLALNSPSDMGTVDYLPDGSQAPQPTVFDIDAIINPASTVSALHAQGDHVICYIEAGSAGNYYSASQEGIASSYYQQLQQAGDLGNTLPGYSEENFVNITSASTISIVESEISQQCAAKGFDAVETDMDETYPGYDGSTGFSQTKAQEQIFDSTLASYIHSRGMGWIAKNLVDTGDNFATLMEPMADGMVTENCNQWGQCGQASAYISNGKGVFNAEYNLSTSQFCAADDTAGIDGAHIDTSVDGFRQPCR